MKILSLYHPASPWAARGQVTCLKSPINTSSLQLRTVIGLTWCAVHFLCPVCSSSTTALCTGKKVYKTDSFCSIHYDIRLYTQMWRAHYQKHDLHVTGGTAQVGKGREREEATHRKKKGPSSKRTWWSQFNKFLPSSFPHSHLYSCCLTSVIQFLTQAHTQR